MSQGRVPLDVRPGRVPLDVRPGRVPLDVRPGHRPGAGGERVQRKEEQAMSEEAEVSATGSIEVEVASQPACWRRAAGLAPEVAGTLPSRGERVAVAGCGTSWFMAQAYAAAREAAGHGETDAFAASEMPTHRRYDRVLVLSRSGTTTEIRQLLGRLRGAVPTVAITAGLPNPVSDAPGATVDLSFADEAPVVQARFAATEPPLLR